MKRYGAAGSSVLGRSKLPTVGYAIRLFFVYYNSLVIIPQNYSTTRLLVGCYGRWRMEQTQYGYGHRTDQRRVETHFES